MKKKIIFALDELEAVADELWSLHTRCLVYTFTGPLGAGKTTLVRQMLKKAGVTTLIVSPTFIYVTIYNIDEKKIAYHFDLYRLESIKDFFQLGFDEYLYAPDSYSFIEWPAIIKPLLTHDVCSVDIDYYGDNKRIITYE